ncbi:MAG: GSU2403 family nucleotidyltransferase fold protein [Acidobacteriota bacterium]
MQERLSPTTQLLYSELLEQSIHAAAEEAMAAHPPGSFVEKSIRGRQYWYLQTSVGGDRHQTYLGPDSKLLRGWIERTRNARRRLEPAERSRAELAGMMTRGGASTVDPALLRVLELLSDAGVFRLGGVLVGTHALGVYGNMLGVRWSGDSLRTHDLDIAQDPVIGVGLLSGLEAPSIPDVLRDSGLGFFAIPTLDPRQPSTSFSIRGRELRVDFLTPLHGPERSRPIYLPSLKVSAQPLRLLDYLIEDSVQGMAIGRRKALLVNVPQPARFALHKLWTSTRRAVAFQAKATKDQIQAAALIEVLLDDRPSDLEAAWRELDRRPKVRADIRRVAGRLGRRGLDQGPLDEFLELLGATVNETPAG